MAILPPLRSIEELCKLTQSASKYLKSRRLEPLELPKRVSVLVQGPTPASHMWPEGKSAAHIALELKKTTLASKEFPFFQTFTTIPHSSTSNLLETTTASPTPTKRQTYFLPGTISTLVRVLFKPTFPLVPTTDHIMPHVYLPSILTLANPFAKSL